MQPSLPQFQCQLMIASNFSGKSSELGNRTPNELPDWIPNRAIPSTAFGSPIDLSRSTACLTFKVSSYSRLGASGLILMYKNTSQNRDLALLSCWKPLSARSSSIERRG